MEIVKINPLIFREYDIRGIYGTEIDINMAYTLGRGFGSYIQDIGETKTIIGHDNRHSSDELSEALITGIRSTGVDVIDLGLVTTPMYYFARKTLKYNTGIMITASHNPKEYNGFKLALDKVANASGKMIYDLRDYIAANNFKDGSGALNTYDIRKEYIELFKKSLNFGPKNIKFVIDCANGTASIIVKDLLDALGLEYYPLYCESDGNFPNHHPDPFESKNMQDVKNKVLELGYDLGIGIDGDGDRVGIVDELGNILQVDLYMISMYRYMVDTMTTKKALYDVKCSRSLIDELDKLGIEKHMNRTGNSYIARAIIEGNFPFGGELSGHVFYNDKFPGIDDGIYAGLRAVEMLSNTDKTFSQTLEGINKYFATEEIKVKVTDENKFALVNKIKEYSKNKGYKIFDMDGVRAEFTDGWALIRASNTGPNITVRFEAKSKERLNEIQKEFMNELERYL